MALVKKYDMDLLRHISLFEKTCRVNPRDCFIINNTVFYIVPNGKAGFAVGKQGANIRIMEKALEKDIRIVEEAGEACGLVKNALFPMNLSYIAEEEGIISIEFSRPMQRRRLLNNKQEELKLLLEMVRRYHPHIKEIKVL